MKDYFNKDKTETLPLDEWANDDTWQRMNERLNSPTRATTEYDKQYINTILNKETLEEPDRYNIATAVEELSRELAKVVEFGNGFHHFLQEKLGEKEFTNPAAEYAVKRYKISEVNQNEDDY